MEPCCYADEYSAKFDHRRAEDEARQFLRDGLPKSAQELAHAVAERGIDGATLLEVGGGVGGLHVHLLQQGAARAVNVELSPEWEEPAQRILTALHLSDRVTRHVGDFVDDQVSLSSGEAAGTAEVVLLHRVVCCYPDWERMLTRVAEHAERLIGLTFPRDRWMNHLVLEGENLMHRIRGRRFRVFVHPAGKMLDLLGREGFRPVADRSGMVWRTVVLERDPATR